ncbi:MAG: BrnT family toxin [Bosea sp. (in: a-proteobacteria)]|jgi:uncharacterized DUF497 family protein|uniref:BrnT family toxin n=1 Tax=Bosea sp. (in: a-proteobacteria) TaxID=1871050 RepID=UPI002733559E|nr:BrnT family toxin [Bosea sp. (in: a-proteobacteria)]MDP3602179.1 BrnT family toxin [Bosea sp. (in: a-proteobacteria)]
MGFQWDEAKSKANEAKHDVSFAEASLVFRGRFMARQDARRDYGEARFIALGLSQGRLLRVVYTRRGGDIRIISAWKASSYDRKIFDQGQ